MCDAAARIFEKRAEELMFQYSLSVLPRIAVESCGAAGMGSEKEGRWLVRFGLTNPQDLPPYKSVEMVSFTLGDESPSVHLDEGSWPAE